VEKREDLDFVEAGEACNTLTHTIELELVNMRIESLEDSDFFL
jgi:hypothetical protein